MELPSSTQGLVALWHKTPKKLLALAGAAAAGVALDRRTLLFSDLSEVLQLALVLRASRKFMTDNTLVPDVFQSAVQRFPQQCCILFEDRSLTYEQVDEISNRVAHWALRQGLMPGDTVALLMENRPEFIITWLGLSKVGVVTALINTHLKVDGLLHCVQLADPKIVIVGEELLAKFARVVDQLDNISFHVYGDGVTRWQDAESAYPFARSLDEQLTTMSSAPVARSMRKGITPLDTAQLIFTSGTTGLPKAARVNHFNILLRSIAVLRPMEVTPSDRLYCPLPLYHSSGGNVAVGICFQTGATLCIARKFSASRFWDDVRRYQCTIVQYIGEMCRYLVNTPPRPSDAENNVRFAFGNGLRPDVWHEFQDRFGIPALIEFYGSTEGVMGFFNHCVTPQDRGHLGRRGSLLKALYGAKFVKYDVENDAYIRDPKTGSLQECGLDEVGELLCKIAEGDPARKFSGYYRNEDETNRKVLRNVFVKGDAYFRSGDLFKIDSNHRWHFVDRVGDTFRWKGENVATNEVAEAIAKFPGLSDICVYGVEVPGNEGRACLAAMVFDDKTFDMQAFATHVQARLPSYAVPLFLRQLGEMSVTGTMKYEKAKLRKQGIDPSQVSDKLWYFVKAKNTYEPLTAQNFHSVVTSSRL